MKTKTGCLLQSWHNLFSTTNEYNTINPKELGCMAVMSKKTEKRTTNYDFGLMR